MRNIRKGDTVEVLSGDDRGKRGTVNRVAPDKTDPSRTKVVVAGVNLIKKHQRRTGDVNTQFGIIEREAPMYISKLGLVCPKCSKVTRVAIEIDADGTHHRKCKECGELIDA